MKNLGLVLAFSLICMSQCLAETPIYPLTTEYLDAAQIKQITGKNTDIDTAAEDLIDNGANFNWPTQAKALQIVSTSAKDIGGRVASGTLTVVDYTHMLGAKNSATVTFTNALSTINGETITVNGDDLAEDVLWHNGNSLGTTAINFAAAVNAMENGETFSATAEGPVVTIQYDTNGDSIGALTLATSNINGIILSSATLTGGEDLLTLTVNGRTFVAGTNFTPATSNADTAAAIVTMLNANGALANDLIATSSGRTITLTALTAGTAGNSITTSSNDSDSLTAAAATLTRGKANVGGVSTITLKGLNGGYLAQEETVIINGTGFATSTSTFLRLNEAYVASAGTNGQNVGTISIKQNGTNLLMAKMVAGDNRSFSSTYTVPAGRTAYVVQQDYGILTASANTTADLELRVRPYGGAFVPQYVNPLGNGSMLINKKLTMPLKITAKSDIIIRGSSAANNSSVVGAYTLIEADE